MNTCFYKGMKGVNILSVPIGMRHKMKIGTKNATFFPFFRETHDAVELLQWRIIVGNYIFCGQKAGYVTGQSIQCLLD